MARESVLLAGGDLSKADTVQDFSHAEGDTIDLKSFGLGGTVANQTGTVSSLAGINGANFYADKQGDVVVSEIGGNTYIFADTNKDGNFEYNSDLVIKVVGTHASDLVATDIKLS